MTKTTDLKIIAVVAFVAAVGVAIYFLKASSIHNHAAVHPDPGVPADAQAAVDAYLNKPMTGAQVQKMVDEVNAAQSQSPQPRK